MWNLETDGSRHVVCVIACPHTHTHTCCNPSSVRPSTGRVLLEEQETESVKESGTQKDISAVKTTNQKNQTNPETSQSELLGSCSPFPTAFFWGGGENHPCLNLEKTKFLQRFLFPGERFHGRYCKTPTVKACQERRGTTWKKSENTFFLLFFF